MLPAERGLLHNATSGKGRVASEQDDTSLGLWTGHDMLACWGHASRMGADLEVHGIQAGAQLLHGVHLRLQLQQVARRGPRALGHLRGPCQR